METIIVIHFTIFVIQKLLINLLQLLSCWRDDHMSIKGSLLDRSDL
jgi:hypothetical protein